MVLRTNSSPCALLDPGGAGSVIVTRRFLFPRLTMAPMPEAPTPPVPPSDFAASAFLPQL
jgi:hypothetical protein